MRLQLLCCTVLLAVGSLSTAHAATVSSVDHLTLDGGNFQKPGGLLTDGDLDQLSTGAAPGLQGASLRGYRNATQTFTISAGDYAYGVDVTAFAINFRNRDDENDPDFGVRLFRILDGDPNTPDGADIVSVPATGAGSLKYPSLDDAGVAGTYIFNFDTPVTLAPGEYAWQFLTEGSGGTTSSFSPVWWVNSDDNADPYSGGDFYFNQNAAAPGPVATYQGRDTNFGLIGTAAVPEPSSVALCGLALAGLGLVARRRRK